MPRRQPLPRLWMMTDERQGDNLFRALARLPEGGGVVFRHYSLAAKDRRELFADVRTMTSNRKQLLMIAGEAGVAGQWGADGVHGGTGKSLPGLLRSASVHDVIDLDCARRAGADLIFVSPVFATRSHPGAVTLGMEGLERIARWSPMPVIALGGMNAARARKIEDVGAYGWAAIDAWERMDPPRRGPA